MSAHPILEELSNQLPESAHTVQFIQEPAPFEKIAVQARSDMDCIENLEGHLKDGRPAKTVLGRAVIKRGSKPPIRTNASVFWAP